MMQRWGQVTSQPVLAAVSSARNCWRCARKLIAFTSLPKCTGTFFPSCGRRECWPNAPTTQRQAAAQFRRFTARVARSLSGRPGARLAARDDFVAPALLQELAPRSCGTGSV